MESPIGDVSGSYLGSIRVNDKQSRLLESSKKGRKQNVKPEKTSHWRSCWGELSDRIRQEREKQHKQ